MQAIQKPITYEAEQHNSGTELSDLKTLLEGTGVIVHQWPNHFSVEYPSPADVLRGRVENIWVGDWLVVSSLGEVRVLREDEYGKEFYEDWEVPATSATDIGLIAKYLYKLVDKAHDDRELDVDPGDWAKLEKIRENKW